MRGLRAVPPAGELVEALRSEGLLTVPAAENVVRILPPLTTSEAEIDEAIAALERGADRFAAAA